MTVHIFASSDEAYDRSQCDDQIADGDILVIPSEGVAGWLDKAWPVAATRNVGAFHRLNEAAAIDAETYGPKTGDRIVEKVAECVAALHAAGHTVVAVQSPAYEAAMEDEAYQINAEYDAEVA
ncbi:hypothetical protein [Nocardia wallacei]|uniref:hypothetical protein n=1 Tax=Nocardia wallacei TaxID=480035 RepID=UPI00245639A5|nr:hypothetical protein [Nocardia wallacei]